MKVPMRPDIPLVVVMCDFRIASSAFREVLVSTPESRARLAAALRQVDPDAGFVSLETCNRMEWIVSTESPVWMGELLAARMVSLWAERFPGLARLPQPAVFTGETAAEHVLRVAAGSESLATGEAQVAGQLQAALGTALAEDTSSVVLRRLAGAAGRVAKAAYRIGFRSGHHRGIHALVALFLRRHFGVGADERRILVLGMGQIGRRAAETLGECEGFQVTRINRTVGPSHCGQWRELAELPALAREADALVVATGAHAPVVGPGVLDLSGRETPLLVMDIGIPRQVHPQVQKDPSILYRCIDHLVELDQDRPDRELETSLEAELATELGQFRRFCRERDVVQLLERIHAGRQELIRERIPAFLETQLAGLDDSTRRDIETAMRKFLQDYADDIHRALHEALEDQGSNT